MCGIAADNMVVLHRNDHAVVQLAVIRLKGGCIATLASRSMHMQRQCSQQ
jgi:hypothetical protein